MASSSLHSAQHVDVGDELLRRFVEAARRAQLVTIVNLARSEAELGELFTAEVCEAFEAEVAFVLAARDGLAVRRLVGAYGLTADQRADLPDDARCVQALMCDEPQLHDGDLLGVEVRELMLVPFAGEVERGVVGVARLYDQPFDNAEAALLEAVVESVKHALERIRLGQERDVLYARERAARREAEATAERLERLQRITGTILSDLPLEGMLRELLERIREIVTVDTAVILLVNRADAGLVLRAAAGANAHIEATVRLGEAASVIRRVVDERREVEADDADTGDPDDRDGGVTRSLIGVPMIVEHEIVGVLLAGTSVRRDFSSDDASLLRLAADRAAIAIENARLYRAAEERGQAALVLGYVADGVFLVDERGTVQLWNPAAEAITGVPAKAAVGRPIDETISGWDELAQGVTVASPQSTCRGRATTLPVEIRDRELWLSVTGVSFAEGTVYAFRDLTEERRLEELKADFVATVSHELRTPIAAVHGAAKTLEREDIVFTDDLRRHLLTVISDQSDRLVQLVNDILVTSQVESGRLVLAREQVEVTDVARGVIEAARTHAPEELSLDLTAPPSLAAVSDRDKLRQVLANLVGNAVKYSRPTGRVEVRLEQHRKHLRMAVRDEGVGIPQPEHQRIFEKFYRLDPNMTGGVSGTGLGLYICRELVRRMGGSIWVESTVGSGSTFFVELPSVGIDGVIPGGLDDAS
jgi:PAS domain S-box-containing protein